MTSSVAEPPHHPSLIADRYRIDGILGKGGIAVVYRAQDIQTGKTLALKRLLLKDNPKINSEINQLFEREYIILSQLSHPNVIEVYEFGKHDTIPYYTMELLDGSELKQLSPLPFEKACSLFLGVCSALSLLHSRQQLHRDLSPRNIHCTKDNQAKLIDFGAIVPMGPCKRVIGTPAFVSPDILGLLDLDARSDLFSLGATLYYALTGNSPFPAKSFTRVRDLWLTIPKPPSELVQGIPKELDQLVLSLIHIDPLARPMNAAIVMEKLSAIAGIELDDQLVYSQATLSTPKLIGREEALSRFKKRNIRMLSSRGSVVSIEGGPGVGRSRFLNTCILEEKLSGTVILRADASDAYKGEWGVVRTLSLQLLDAMPEFALKAAKPHLPILGHILPELVSRMEQSRLSGSTSSGVEEREPASTSEVFQLQRMDSIQTTQPPPSTTASRNGSEQVGKDPQTLRMQLHQALSDWMKQGSQKRCLMLAIDDFHHIDEPSAAFVTLLAQEIRQHKLMIAVTVERGASCAYGAILKLLQESSTRIKLRNLEVEHTELLLGSIFGDISNRGLLADRIQHLTDGNPNAVIHYLQHLIDRGIACYRAGTWTFPNGIEPQDLPSHITETLQDKINRLDPATRELAQTMTLNAEQSFTHEECLMLTTHGNRSRLLKSLDQLIALKMVVTDGVYFSFSQKGWGASLTEQLQGTDERACHLRLAEVFNRRGSDLFWSATHLLKAGQEELALDRFIEFAEASRVSTVQNAQSYLELIQSLPNDWFDILMEAIELARTHRRPAKQIYQLQLRLCGLVVLDSKADMSSQVQLLVQLIRDSGLEAYYELGDSLPVEERLEKALQLTQQRYDSLPERMRVLPPVEAIRELARVLIQALGVAAKVLNISFYKFLPSIEPLVPLSPALEIVEKLLQSAHDGVRGRVEKTWRQDREILDRLEQSDRAGLQETHHKYTRYFLLHAQGIYDSIAGRKSALKCAEELEGDPLLQSNVCRIRMLYYLWQGEQEKAEGYIKQLEVLQIQNRSHQINQWTHLLPKLWAFCLADDLMGVRQSMAEIEPVAKIGPGWMPTFHFAKGEYQRIRGDFAKALSELQQALDQTEAGQYRGWISFASSYLKTLYALGQYKQAAAQGKAFLEVAEKEELGYLCYYLKMPLAMAQAKLGDFSTAINTADSVIDGFHKLGSTGLNLGVAYECRAYLAVSMGHRKDLAHYSELCAQQFRVGKNPALTAKYERLVQEANQHHLNAALFLSHRKINSKGVDSPNLEQISHILEEGRSPKERAELALKLLIQKSHSKGGLLYIIKNKEPILTAISGEQMESPEMRALIKEFLSKELNIENYGTVTCDKEFLASTFLTNSTNREDDSNHPILLGHSTPKGYTVVGIALLIIKPRTRFIFPINIIESVSKALSTEGDSLLV